MAYQIPLIVFSKWVRMSEQLSQKSYRPSSQSTIPRATTRKEVLVPTKTVISGWKY
jgi:hypothetical protein